jgi:thioredoxin reductase
MRTCDIAIIGAGPYGLSLAAHLRPFGLDVRIFGGAMEFWLKNMPKGMHLKSEGFASSIYDPGATFTLETFCKAKGLDYAAVGNPVPLETFCAYGLAFQGKFAPQLEDCKVVSVDRANGGFEIVLDTGETFVARRVVVAAGVTHFAHVPEHLSTAPADLVSHSSAHNEVDQFRGREVAIIGGGASALDLAALLHQAGSSVQVFTRAAGIKFNDRGQSPRPLIQELRHPSTGIGPGWRSLFYASAPHLFRQLPEQLRLKIVRQHLGPAPGWFVKDHVVGNVPLNGGAEITGVERDNGRAKLRVSDSDGKSRTIDVDHVIAATGYKVRLGRLSFLSPQILNDVRSVDCAPELSSTFESSIPGLYFVGASAANTFGPMMRFAFGAGFCAERVSRRVAGECRVKADKRVPSKMYSAVSD